MISGKKERGAGVGGGGGGGGEGMVRGWEGGEGERGRKQKNE